jgi:3-hydroxybutyryl-CoA dehydrogenase
MENQINPSEITIGVVGLGLMGCSICTCLLLAGHKVVAIAPISSDMNTAYGRIDEHLNLSFTEKLTKNKPIYYFENLVISEDFFELRNCKIVIECTLENIEIKQTVYQKIENIIDKDAILTSNTSAIPISILQKECQFPERFLGLHWSEPSHTTRFLEIICGELAHFWEKEPTLVRKDIRGFITNRLMYAMYREACYLVENDFATIEDVDRACRNNPGYWMTLVGVFRWMDLTGVPAYHTVMKDLLPTLSNQTTIPKLIDDIVKAGGKGTANAHGFYNYTPEEAKLWEETYHKFSYDIREIALKYPADVVERQLVKKE